MLGQESISSPASYSDHLVSRGGGGGEIQCSKGTVDLLTLQRSVLNVQMDRANLHKVLGRKAL